jgi:1,4-dihydroxy-2-naphthoate octaprenyltransferase
MMFARPWILASRPRTLSAAIVPVIIGTSMAPGPIRWSLFGFALAGALLIQIATNFVNDALDFKKGADSDERLGPLRVTQAGLLSAGAVLRAAWLCLFLATLCGIPLILRAGWPLLAIGAASIAAAYVYTGGPYPLAYHGLGELFVIVFFGFLAVGGSYFVQTLTIDAAVLAAGFAAGSLATVLLVINNLRDVESDRGSAKRTLAVRFGKRFSRVEVAFFSLAPFATLLFIAALRGRTSILLPLVALPLAGAVIACARKSAGRALNRCLALAGALQWAFGILFVVGAVL